MRGVEVVWGMQTADKVQRLMVEATGQPCPCDQGRRCPFLGPRVSLVERQPVATPLVLVPRQPVPDPPPSP